MENSEGKTPVSYLRDRHIDAIKLDILRLTKVAYHYSNAIRKQNHHCRFTKNEVANLILEAVKSERVNVKHLKDKSSG